MTSFNIDLGVICANICNRLLEKTILKRAKKYVKHNIKSKRVASAVNSELNELIVVPTIVFEKSETKIPCVSRTSTGEQCCNIRQNNSLYCGIHKIAQLYGTIYDPYPSIDKNISKTGSKTRKKNIPSDDDLRDNYVKVTEITLDNPTTGRPTKYMVTSNNILMKIQRQQIDIVGKIISDDIHWYCN